MAGSNSYGIAVQNINLGGIAESAYQGAKNSCASILGADLHTEPGIIRANYRMAQRGADITNPVNELVKSIVDCSDGLSYYFGSSQIWSRAANGTYAREVSSVGGGAVRFACEYNGYIFYSTATGLGRWTIGTAWSTRNDTWAVLQTAAYHPMIVNNGILYIGDGYFISQVDGTTFTSNVFDLDNIYTITALHELGDDIVIGTRISDKPRCNIFMWDRYSSSWQSVQEIPETGVNAFVVTDSAILISVGERGAFYSLSRDRVLGTIVSRVKRIPGTFNSSNKGIVYSGAVENFFGLPVFGFSGTTGTPAKCGIYSIGSHASNFPYVLNLEFILSVSAGGQYDSIEIGAIRCVGTILIVAWKYGSTYGVDELDLTTRGTAVIETQVYNYRRDSKKMMKAVIPYRTDGTIQLDTKSSGGNYVTQTLTKDSDRNLYYTKNFIQEGVTIQARLTVSGNAEIEGLFLNESVS